MKDFIDHLMDIQSFVKALESIQLKPKEKADLVELYASKRGVSVTRDKGNRVRGDHLFWQPDWKIPHCIFNGIRPGDLMMWVGHIEEQSDGSELWIMRPEVRSVIKRLRWF